jgi:hypothetical protein
LARARVTSTFTVIDPELGAVELRIITREQLDEITELASARAAAEAARIPRGGLSRRGLVERVEVGLSAFGLLEAAMTDVELFQRLKASTLPADAEAVHRLAQAVIGGQGR